MMTGIGEESGGVKWTVVAKAQPRPGSLNLKAANNTGRIDQNRLADSGFILPEIPTECFSISVSMAMDGDRDSIIDFDSVADRKYLFWVNDDVDYVSDVYAKEEDDIDKLDEITDLTGHVIRPGRLHDCDDDLMNCKRDLEDFTRLHMQVSSDRPLGSGLRFFMGFDGDGSSAPQINLFKAIKPDLSYLENRRDADTQLNERRILTIGSGMIEVPPQYFQLGQRMCFLIEGKKPGKANLTLMVKQNGLTLGRAKVLLDIRPIESFYQKYVVRAVSGNNVTPAVDSSALSQYRYEPTSNEYFLQVHGWNMPDWEKDRWTATVFKRLWWLGYKGHVGGLHWPTHLGMLSYDNSEHRAWNSGLALAGLLKTLNNKHPGQVRMFVHSMGNIVAGEALRLLEQPIVHTYFASQAAIPSHMYDASIEPFRYWANIAGITTPELYRHFHSGLAPDQSYLVQNKAKVLHGMIQCFNVDDYALNWWDLNNALKPDTFSGYGYEEGDFSVASYNPSKGDFFYRDYPSLAKLDIDKDKFEIFAWCTESRSRALGAQHGLVAGFSAYLNYQRYGYDSKHYSHSRQFRNNIQMEWPVWLKIGNMGDLSDLIPLRRIKK